MTEKKILKSSRQRGLILKILRGIQSHPYADIIYEIARKEMPNISKGTVYRNLKILKNEGKIQELTISRGVVRYDGDVREHYHINCLECGRVDNLPHISPRIPSEEICDLTGYQVHSQKLEVKGVCPDCHKSRCEDFNDTL